MAPAEQDDVSNDDHDSGLDGGSGNSDDADFGLDGDDAAAMGDHLADLSGGSASDWVGRSRNTRGAETPGGGLSAENLARIDQVGPRPRTLWVRTRGGRRQLFVRPRSLRGQSSVQNDTPQNSLAQRSDQPVLRLRGDRSQSSEQQATPHGGLAQGSEQHEIPQDDLAQRGEQPVLRLRGARNQIREQEDAPQDGPVQSSEQQGIASHDDPSQENSATDTASDAGQDEQPLIDFGPETGT